LRYFIELSYNGKDYHGWQSQPNAISVQEVVENALSKILGMELSIVGAGRTDAGVHAKDMFAHFDCKEIEDSTDLVHRLNNYLPSDIAVKSIVKVSDDAHARFDAVERTYEYWIVQEKNPFQIETAHYIWSSLDIDAMNKAASILMEYEDFECFSKSKTEVNTYLCDITRAQWLETEDEYHFHITANRFLRNMVRAIVGTLLEIGQGKKPVSWIHDVVKGKSRSQAGSSVPGHGLYLTEIIYPETIYINNGRD